MKNDPTAGLDLRLLAILDPTVLRGRDPVHAAREAADGGATAIQVRVKDGRGGNVLALVERLVRLVPVPIWVNDRADVAFAADAAGVHLGQEDLAPERVRRFAPPGFGIGLSVGSEPEAATAAGAPVDYWSIGSIYMTRHKLDAGEPIGLPGFQRLRALAPHDFPVIAIGGVSPDTAGELIAHGASGVASIGSVFGADDVARAARRLRDAVDAALG